MWKEYKIEDYLKNNLKEKRFKHSLGVRDTAIKMGKVYHEDINKLRIAGLVHDCAKNIEESDLIKIAKDHNYEIDSVSLENPQLLHGPVGAMIAKDLMNIDDKDILNAIEYHTTGKGNMSMLEKIIYIADYIEPLRKYNGVEQIRKLAYEDIDKALLKSFNTTIQYVIKKDQMIHINTIEGRNYILKIVGE